MRGYAGPGLAIALLAAVLLPAPPVAAAPAEHLVVEESWSGSEHFAAGEGPCVPWAGTLAEDRHMTARLVWTGTGPRVGEYAVVAQVDGALSLVPDDATAAPTYAGSYRETATGRFSWDGDEPRVGRFAVHARATGSDGSALLFVLYGRITLRADGTVVTVDEGLRCVR